MRSAGAAPASGGVLAFTVYWPLELHPAEFGDATSVICGVDGSGQTYRLTDPGSGSYSNPAWSPDGLRLAVQQTGSFDAGIAVFSPSMFSADPALGPNHAASPAWSPDGASLAFISPPPNFPGGGHVWVGALSAKTAAGWRVLTAGSSPDDHPSWAPDGRRLAYNDFAGEIHVVAADGSSDVNVTRDAQTETDPAWSPDGTQIAFVSGAPFHLRFIEVMNADGNGRRQLHRGESPAWSPSGDAIAFVQQGDLHVVQSGGTGDRILYRDALSDGLSWQAVAHPELIVNLPPCPLRVAPGKHALSGTPFDDVLYGSTSHDAIIAGAGNDIVYGLAGADKIEGGQGSDQVDASTGNDVVDGQAGNDLLVGGAGNDTLNGGNGVDVIRAGSGNDSIQARDGVRDVISCGSGRDTIYADQFDSVAKDCERVLLRHK